MKLRARAEADKERRNAAILKAAREIWSRRGFDFTMTEVAERAGVVKGTIYLYFPTKDDLLAAIAERMVGEYLDRVNRAIEKRKRWTLSQVAALFSDSLVLPVVPRSNERLEETAELIEAHVAGLRRGDALRFVRCATALVAGFARANRCDIQYAVTALAYGMEKRR